MHKYGEIKTTRIMMATVRHVTAWAGRSKYQADGFFSTERTTVAVITVVLAPDDGRQHSKHVELPTEM